MASESGYRLPRDHGYAVVQDMADGTKKVMVCGRVFNGEPQDVYAIHFKCRELHVQPGVTLSRTESSAYTKQIVEVYSEKPGVVALSAPARGKRSLLHDLALRR